MSNFKSGSGNLDFGGSDEDEVSAPAETTETDAKLTEEAGSADDRTPEQSQASISGEADSQSELTTSETATTDESAGETAAKEQYPYFIRRNNVGDERDTRLEIHVRDTVADQEPAFRNELAAQLDVNEISKTDAREFALLAAYQNPEQVAELLRDEGFGTL